MMSEIPLFLHDLLLREYGPEAERIEAGYRVRRACTLRANTLKITSAEAEGALRELGFSPERVSWYESAFCLPAGSEGALASSELFASGKIYLQSLSSMLPPLLLSPKRGESVLDMTAAPGSKTTQLAALSGGEALITACERDKIRFGRLKFNLDRQGAHRVNAMLCDAAALDPNFRFDKILLDAPCSGSGTIDLTSASPPKFGEKLLLGCLRAQERLLKKGLSLLKAGGTLLYSTCSVLKEENEEMAAKVLRDSGCELAPIEAPFLFELPLLRGADGTVTLCPTERFEGFFLAKFIKR